MIPATIRAEFCAAADIPVRLTLADGDVELLAGAKESPSGLCSFRGKAQAYVRIGGRPVKCNVTVIVSVPSSTHWPKI
jgi:hypothetical protein